MMWYNKTQQYLRKSFTRSGRGIFLLGKDSNNLAEVISVDGNGSQQSVLADNTGAQVFVTSNQLNVVDTASSVSLASILAVLSASSGNAAESTSATYTLTTSMSPIGSASCKQVTLLNLSTNPTIQLQINGGSTIYLEAGYSMTIPCSDINLIQAKTTTDGEVLSIIYSV